MACNTFIRFNDRKRVPKFLVMTFLLVALSWGGPHDPDAPQWHGNAGHISLAQ